MKKLRGLDSISHIVLLGTLFIAASVIIFVHYDEYKNIRASISRTENTEDLDKRVTTLKLGFQQMLINQRGYISLGIPKYRKSFLMYANALDDHIIDVSKSFTDDESDKLIKSVNSKVAELKILLQMMVEDREKGRPVRFSDRASNQKILALYDGIADDLEQLSWMIWSRHQDNMKDTKEAYGNYSQSLLLSSLISVVIFGMLGTMLLHSQKKTARTQGELGELNQRLNILLQATSDGILDWDLKNNKLLISPKFKKLLGYDDDEIRSDFDSIFNLIHPDDKLSTWLYARKLIAPEQPVYNQIFRMKHKDGSWAWISAKGIGFFDKAGEMERFIGVHTDVTLQKNLENILKYSKDKAEIEGQQKSDFLAYMSHEIRSPVGAVIGLAKILSETSPLTPEQKKYLEALKNGADTIYGLLNNILDLSKLDANATKIEKTEFNLKKIISDTVSLALYNAREKGLKLSSDIPADADGIFIGDPHRIRQIVNNLLSNAIKFTEEGGVNLTVRLLPDSEGNAKAEIIVQDSGIGIPEDKLAVIFDPYIQSADEITRKYGGTGLGLAISKQFSELMNGKIEVESEAGKGSRFKVTLPLERGIKLKPVTVRKLKRPKSDAKNTVLIVEDYAPNVIIAETLLGNLGYDCISVATVKDAILELSSKAGEAIRIVFMDVQLPDMNGFEATKLIRKLEKDNAQQPRKIIAMTAYDLIGDREKCIQAGMDDYISKPFTTEELLEKLQQPQKTKATA